MGRGKKSQPEQVVSLLRQIEVSVANGKTTALGCKEAGIVERAYFRCPKEYGGLQVDQAKRLKELEQANSKLKRGRLWPRTAPRGWSFISTVSILRLNSMG